MGCLLQIESHDLEKVANGSINRLAIYATCGRLFGI